MADTELDDGGEVGFAEAIVRTMSQPLLVLSADLTVESANPAFYRVFNTAESEIAHRRLYDIDNGQWNISRLRELLEQVLPGRQEVCGFRVDHEFPRIGRRIMLVSARRMQQTGQRDRILVAIDDITERERAQAQIHAQTELAGKIIDASREALLILDTDLRVHSANQTFYDTFRVERQEAEGRLVYDLGNGQWDIPRLRELLENVLPDNEAFDDFKVEHDFKNIGHRVMLLNARRINALKLILLAIEDVTERQRSEDRFRRALDIETVGIAFWDDDIRITRCNRTFCQMTGFAAGELAGRHWRDLTPPAYHAKSEQAIAQIRSHGVATPYVKAYRRKDGKTFWGLFAPRRLGDGETIEFVLDVTDRVEAENQRDLLLAELNHRVKNIFAVVRAIAMQGNGQRTTVEYRETFLGRLEALMHAHDLVFEGEWRHVGLDEIAENALKAYGTEATVVIDGPPVKIAPRPALSLSLVLHELATNATKHGALSVPEGSVHISWQTAGDQSDTAIHIQWTESGGPRIGAPPECGFGTKLITRIFDYQLEGEADLDFTADGLRFRASFGAD